MKLNFGERNFVIFASEDEYYEALGFLTNPKRVIKFDWEDYDNKWGVEGRIWIGNSANAPVSLARAFSAGNQSYMHRLNCNEYLDELISNFGIPMGKVTITDHNAVKRRVPSKYMTAFIDGFNL